MNKYKRMSNSVIRQAKSPYRKMFKDYDRDGVLNVYDCQPKNPRKQGVVDYIAKRYGEHKYRKEERAKTRRAVIVTEMQAERREAIKEAQEKAKAKRKANVKKYKARLSGKRKRSLQGALFGIDSPMGTKKYQRKKKKPKKKFYE